MVIDVSMFPGDRYYLLVNYGTWPLGGDPEFKNLSIEMLGAPVAADMPGAIGME